MLDGFLKGIPDADDLLKRLQKIVGGTIRGNTFDLSIDLHWDTPQEAKAVKTRVQEMELKLRQLRTDVVNTVQRINADFDALKAKLVGQPAAQKAFVRQQQLEVRQSYEDIKKTIDSLLLQMKNARQAIDQDRN